MKILRLPTTILGLLLILAQFACSGDVTTKETGGRSGPWIVALPSSIVVLSDRTQAIAFGPDGRQFWSFSLPDGDVIAASPAAANSSMTYLRGDKSLYAISPEGNLVWSARLDEPNAPIKGIVALGDSTVAVTKGESQLVGYTPTGQVRWTFTLPEGDRLIAAPGTAPNSAVLLRGANGLYAVDPNGNLAWQAQVP